MRKIDTPVTASNTPVVLTTVKFNFDIPLLLNKEAMKKNNISIIFKKNYLELFQKKYSLHFTLSGRYFTSIANIPYLI